MKTPNQYQKKTKHNKIYPPIVFLIWLLLWELAAIIINSEIFLPAPIPVVKKFLLIVITREFWNSVIFSISNIMTGYILGIVAGLFFAWISYLYYFIECFISFPLKIIKSVPIASFIILALLWLNSKHLSILISFLMVLPIIYTNVLTGLKTTDSQLLEMAHIYNISSISKIKYIYLPTVLPHLFSGMCIGAGLAWKSGIAAEVIGITRHSIGNQLYQAKIYLETTELFAWTITVIIISLCFEKLLNIILNILCSYTNFNIQTDNTLANKIILDKDTIILKQYNIPKKNLKEISKTLCKSIQNKEIDKTNDRLITNIINISKSYNSTPVFKDYSFSISLSSRIALLGSSGIGKTTLINIISGLTPADTGKVLVADNIQISMVFQEDRLIEHLSAIQNLQLISKNFNSELASEILISLKLEQHINQKVATFSGGMKRRVAIARALYYCLNNISVYEHLLIMDEPFKGLDNDLKRNIINYINTILSNTSITLLLITHDMDESNSLDCEITYLKNH